MELKGDEEKLLIQSEIFMIWTWKRGGWLRNMSRQFPITKTSQLHIKCHRSANYIRRKNLFRELTVIYESSIALFFVISKLNSRKYKIWLKTDISRNQTKKISWKANMKDTANNPTQHVSISCHPLETLKAKQETVVRKS